MSARHAVPLELLERDGRALVEADGRRVAVFRVGETIHAVENECPHAGNPLIEGELVGGELVCVYHRWRFDLATGACLVGTAPARTFPVEVRDRAAWVDLGSSG